MFKKNLQILAILGSVIWISSCSKDDDHNHANEEELITTVTYTLSPANGGNAIALTFKDLDGDGGNNPVITGGTLAANTTYTGSLTLLNESETPAENVTDEVKAEDEEHQVFFKSDITTIGFSYSDQDADGNPLGLSSQLTTGAAASGNITITLRHEPNKSATGVAGGDITNAGGETDIEVTFPISVI